MLSGIAEPVESAVILTAAQLLGAASAVREIRERAVETLDTLSALESTRPSPTTRRTVLAALSNELSAMHTKLSFEVESQVDAVHVPEIVIEQYQASLAGTLGLATAADTTSRMLDRLTAAIAAASEALERRERESDDDRRFRVTLALTVASLVAVPVTVLFAFYGVNATEVPATNSLWDTSYWPAWVAVGRSLRPLRHRRPRPLAHPLAPARRSTPTPLAGSTSPASGLRAWRRRGLRPRRKAAQPQVRT